MPELIDRVEVIKELEMSAVFFPEYKDGIHHAIDALNYAPIIDAEPIIRGHWMFHEQKNGYLWKCSNCRGNFEQQFSYCPHCGAKMT